MHYKLYFFNALKYNFSMNDSSIKAVAYARVSTLLGQNPEHQLEHIRIFATARGFSLIRQFVDSGVSGAKERRPALDEMIREARKGSFKIIIISGIDRLARDTRHLLNLINELNHYGVSIISLRENIDFSTPVGQATLTIFGAVAQLKRELIRERIRNALAAKKLAAERLGLNWKCGRKTKVNDELALTIKKLSSEGTSVRKISKLVGVSKSTVQRVLGCPENQSKSASSKT
jgi:DNA invertase Pin-like site-specific DNA recombinase